MTLAYDDNRWILFSCFGSASSNFQGSWNTCKHNDFERLRNDCRNAKLHFQMTISLSSTSCLLKLPTDLRRRRFCRRRQFLKLQNKGLVQSFVSATCVYGHFFFIFLAMALGLILAPSFVGGANFFNWRDCFLFGDFSLTIASFTFQRSLKSEKMAAGNLRNEVKSEIINCLFQAMKLSMSLPQLKRVLPKKSWTAMIKQPRWDSRRHWGRAWKKCKYFWQLGNVVLHKFSVNKKFFRKALRIMDPEGRLQFT